MVKKRKDKRPDSIVSTATELGLAIHYKIEKILVKGVLATALNYGQMCLLIMEISIIFLFVSLFLAVYDPGVMLPMAMIFGGIIGTCFLPLIFLRLIHVPLTLLLSIKSKYHKVSFNSSSRKLLLISKAKHSFHNNANVRLLNRITGKTKFKRKKSAAQQQDDKQGK